MYKYLNGVGKEIMMRSFIIENLILFQRLAAGFRTLYLMAYWNWKMCQTSCILFPSFSIRVIFSRVVYILATIRTTKFNSACVISTGRIFLKHDCQISFWSNMSWKWPTRGVLLNQYSWWWKLTTCSAV